MEKVATAEISINQRSQIKHFQFILPQDAVRIIGVEHNVWMEKPFSDLILETNDPFFYNLNQMMGVLKLQTCDNTNIFYNRDVRLDIYGFSLADFSTLWQPKCFSHQGKKAEDPISIPVSSPIVYGYFKDQMNEDIFDISDIAWCYRITVYLWYETLTTQP